jgi:nitrous oxidase accessory protein NosD
MYTMNTQVKESVFTGNGVGLRFHSTPILVSGNTFSDNGTGLRFHFGTPTITGNRFIGNGTAIFISQDPGETVITGNDFIDSMDYHVSLGEMVDADIEATGNYWGSADPAEVAEMFYDASKWDHLGRVIREPAATSPVAGER